MNIVEQDTESFADNQVPYNHPEIFEKLDITPTESPENPERVTYEIPDVGVMSLLRIDDYDGKRILQVDIAEVDEGIRGQGFGVDMYRYVANHLPPGYSGILSGTITNEAIYRIYESLGEEFGFELHRLGNPARPMYLLETIER